MTNTIHRLMRPLAAAFVGALTTLAFAPYQLWPVAILSPLLLLLLLHKQSVKGAALIGYCWGLGQFGIGINWVHISIDTFGGMPKIASVSLMLLLVGYLAIYPALFAWALNRFFPASGRGRLLLAAPALWLVSDWLRGWVMTGFPWLWLGYSQIDSPLANYAPLGGVELLTLMVMLSAGALALTLLSKSKTLLLIPAVIFAAGYGLNAARWVKPDTDKTTKVALIQGNIPQARKWLPSERWPTIMKYTDLTRENWDADIIIWPEAAVPAFEFELTSYLHNLDAAARLNHSTIITGILNQTDDKQYYNSVLALGDTPQGEYQYDVSRRFHKHHLLPFGEFVPFEDLLRPLAPFFNLPMSSFTAGDYIQPNIIASGHALTPALCYEIIFNEQVRANTTDDTDFLLTLSNDAWFGRSIGPLQHMEIARMRALELGKPLIRATNNGVTAVTDYRGQITAQIPQFETGVLRAELVPTRGQTPYHALGSWPLYMWTALAMLAGLLLQRRRHHPDADS
ncbi:MULTISPECIES: apolipoprotein N-acyltransferase [unclassified Vibrio]|uniref:apolipoprotein N-acyltransferase n=1 Tax=unclassified Vibrio TaxID=2614977 RepID=UPI0010A62961|nr:MULTISPECIES: apolipoprotein N-acyltransferase [unclassified Vibrio]WGY46331.1 apolipoprotein N-acyltransferase [Vibrio sp. ABG19]